uniref:Ribonuclease H-like domain-containing protein n=1 Tax=Tanacetum cinerariifolium TaxID=118510 RepID=A0A6L2ME89_TANCI|nr:ribonuclease H-like domain-containing protein [Tanacetum cinerariifolium]
MLIALNAVTTAKELRCSAQCLIEDKDFVKRLRTGNLYPVTAPSPIPHAFLSLQGSSRGDDSTQLEGIDVDETFSPVVKHGTIEIVLTLATFQHWPPPGFRDSKHPDYVCLLQRSIYGLKQAPRAWFQRFASYITRVGFQHSRCDSSLLYIDRKKYVVEILERAHMVSCNPSRTPIDTKSKLGADGDPVSDLILYRSLAGSLRYLMFIHHDISYAVQHVCLYMHDHREPYLYALKRILRYVHGTMDYGLQLFSSSTIDLVAYSDADWVGCPTTRRSTSGYYVFIGNNLLSWSFKRQPMLSRSSAEAEYRSVADVVAQTCWLRNLLRELHTPRMLAHIYYRYTLFQTYSDEDAMFNYCCGDSVEQVISCLPSKVLLIQFRNASIF